MGSKLGGPYTSKTDNKQKKINKKQRFILTNKNDLLVLYQIESGSVIDYKSMLVISWFELTALLLDN